MVCCRNIHFLFLVFGERAPASSRPPNARDERRRFGAFAVRITPTPTSRLTTVPADVCSLLNKHQTAPSARRSPLGELCPVSSQLAISCKSSCGKSGVPSFYERFWRDRVASPRGFPCEGCALHGDRRTGSPGRSPRRRTRPGRAARSRPSWDNHSAARCCSWSLGLRLRRLAHPSGVFDPDRLGHDWRGLAIRATSWFAGRTPCSVDRLSAFIVVCRPLREPASVNLPPRHSMAAPVIGSVVLAGLGLIGFAVRGVRGDHLPIGRNRCERDASRGWRVGRGPQSIRRGGSRRGLCAARMGNRRRRLVRDPSESAPRRRHSTRSRHNREGWAVGCWRDGSGVRRHGFYEIIHARYLHIRRPVRPTASRANLDSNKRPSVRTEDLRHECRRISCSSTSERLGSDSEHWLSCAEDLSESMPPESAT